MHAAVPTCEECGEPVGRYVSSFSERGIEEEMLACECTALKLRHAPQDRLVEEETVPDTWPSGERLVEP